MNGPGGSKRKGPYRSAKSQEMAYPHTIRLSDGVWNNWCHYKESIDVSTHNEAASKLLDLWQQTKDTKTSSSPPRTSKSSESSSMVEDSKLLMGDSSEISKRMEEPEDSKRQLIYSSIISQHADHLLTKLYVQFIKRRNCDLTIKLSDMWLYAHTCVLDAFTGNHGNVKFSNLEGKTVLDLSKFQCDIILPLVEMMYTGELAVIPNLVEEVAKAAKYIGFQEAYKGCEVYMKFHKKDQEEQSSTPTTKAADNLKQAHKKHQSSNSEGLSTAVVKGQTGGDKDYASVQIKQEPLDDYETPSSIQPETPVPISGIIQHDSFGASGLYRSLKKREKKDSPDTSSRRKSSPEMEDTTDIAHTSETKDRSYGGNWAKHTMNLNEDFASHKEVAKNVYTVLPYRPSTEDVYGTKIRGRPKGNRMVPNIGNLSNEYLSDNFNIDMEDVGAPPEIYFDNTIGKYDLTESTTSEIDRISRELTESVLGKDFSKTQEKGKGKKRGRKRKSEQISMSNNKSDDTVGKELKTEHGIGADFSNIEPDQSYIEVKREVLDTEYGDINPEQNTLDLSEDLLERKKSLRKRKKVVKQDYLDYYDSDDVTTSYQGFSKDIQAQMDDIPYVSNAKFIYSNKGKSLKTSTKPIISATLLKGDSYVGTVCQKLSHKQARWGTNKYLGDDDSESDDDVDSSDEIEVPVGVKVIPPVAIVPEGTRSRYTQPTVADVNDKFVKTSKGGMKKVAREVKYKPKIFQGHQEKSTGPVYVMCHPTKPIVRL